MGNKVLYTLFLMILLAGCAAEKEVKNVYLADGKYDTGYPEPFSPAMFERLGESVLLVNSVAYYNGYYFGREDSVTLVNLSRDIAGEKARYREYFDKSNAGTATMLSYINGMALMLGCAHVVEFSDTLVSYYMQGNRVKSRYIQSIAYKINQKNYVAGLPGGGEIEILVSDSERDLVLLGSRGDGKNLPGIHELNLPLGNSDELAWGNFVYVLGYPRNKKMMTTAVVSKDEGVSAYEYLIDAVINRGYSGGPVMAVRDGMPNLEFVGIIRSAPADYIYYMQPEPLKEKEIYDSTTPYKGNIFVNYDTEVKYGMANVIPVNSIIRFISEQREFLEDKGYPVDSLFAD